jgi:hypothetical protein
MSAAPALANKGAKSAGYLSLAAYCNAKIKLAQRRQATAQKVH